ncbi:MAG: restriction endonuclease, SacI family [Planctomycetota bacterium]
MNVEVGGINDPDRRSPLDIAVALEGGTTLAIEVRDKSVRNHDVMASLEKTLQSHAAVRKFAFLMLSRSQSIGELDEAAIWANLHGAEVSFFSDLMAFFFAMKLQSACDVGGFEGHCFRAVVRRAESLGANRAAIESLVDLSR